MARAVGGQLRAQHDRALRQVATEAGCATDDLAGLEVRARAQEFGVPTYLDTAKPENLPYYGSFGFAPIGQTELPRGAPLWFMFRELT